MSPCTSTWSCPLVLFPARLILDTAAKAAGPACTPHAVPPMQVRAPCRLPPARPPRGRPRLNFLFSASDFRTHITSLSCIQGVARVSCPRFLTAMCSSPAPVSKLRDVAAAILSLRLDSLRVDRVTSQNCGSNAFSLYSFSFDSLKYPRCILK